MQAVTNLLKQKNQNGVRSFCLNSDQDGQHRQCTVTPVYLYTLDIVGVLRWIDETVVHCGQKLDPGWRDALRIVSTVPTVAWIWQLPTRGRVVAIFNVCSSSAGPTLPLGKERRITLEITIIKLRPGITLRSSAWRLAMLWRRAASAAARALLAASTSARLRAREASAARRAAACVSTARPCSWASRAAPSCSRSSSSARATAAASFSCALQK